MKKILFWFFLLININLLFAPILASELEIVPKADNKAVVDAVDAISDWGWGNVRDNYDAQAKKLEWKVGEQLSSGIMTRSTLLDYLVYVIQFLSEAGLLIWAMMIIYAGYMYASSIFGWAADKGKKAITNAILGVLVIVFSYAIMKIITSAFIT